MRSIPENALILLRVMVYELNLPIDEPVTQDELRRASDLDDEALEAAISHLTQRGFATSYIGAAPVIALTHRGLEFVEAAMSTRLPLSLDAERILRYCVQLTHQAGDDFENRRLMQALKLNREQFEHGVLLLSSFGLVKEAGDTILFISATPQGVQAVRNNFKKQEVPLAPPSSSSYQIQNMYGHLIHQNSGTANYTFNQLAREIEQRGGDDVEELKEMVEEIRRLLMERDSLHAGDLGQFSTLMERHSWITGSVAQLILGWLVGTLTG